NNILVSDQFILTHGVRFDTLSHFGLTVSPGLNMSYTLSDGWVLRGGVAQAFKAPNLLQLNPNYLWSLAGNGCKGFAGAGVGRADPRPGCVVVGNSDLEPQQATNCELGISS